MPGKKQQDTTRIDTRQTEQKSLVTDVVVPIAQSGVTAGVGAWVGGKVSQGKNPSGSGKDK